MSNFCPDCRLTCQNKEIKSLCAAIDVLTADLAEVKSSLKELSQGRRKQFRSDLAVGVVQRGHTSILTSSVIPCNKN